jgi:very-short-patch-repair endonuclease
MLSLPSLDGRGLRGGCKPMTDNLVPLAKLLRKGSTDAEMLLWSRLRVKQLDGIKFRRQQPIEQFIVDFVSFENRLVVELDGGQHAESVSDRERDKLLKGYGFKVLRIWNNEIFENIDGVLETILTYCRAPSPSPPPVEGGGTQC